MDDVFLLPGADAVLVAVADGAAGAPALAQPWARPFRGVSRDRQETGPVTGRCDLRETCAPRLKAVASGAFFPNFVHGWIWRDAKHPNRPWHRCPWCDRALPSMAEVSERVMRGVFASEEWHDEDGIWDGEDGG